MKITELNLAVVQDSASYNELLGLLLEEAKRLRIETTLPAGLAMLDQLASGADSGYHLLALDENLSGDDDGRDGSILYKKYLELGLENVVPVVSISSYSQVHGIRAIGGNIQSLIEHVKTNI